MYGKIFGTMYAGSMVGSGAATFAVMGYVISMMQPDKVVGAQVDLNPKLLAFVFGEKESVIQEAINKLCEKDPQSRTPDEEGRRLIRLGQFTYRVVNGPKYLAIRSREEKREADRDRKRKERSVKGKPLPGEQTAVRAMGDGDEAGSDHIGSESIKSGKIATVGNGLNDSVKMKLLAAALENGDEVTVAMLEKAGIRLPEVEQD